VVARDSIDTPTICNLIEIAAPEGRGMGYTASHLNCPFPHKLDGIERELILQTRQADLDLW
jgi:hypothetical protein